MHADNCRKGRRLNSCEAGKNISVRGDCKTQDKRHPRVGGGPEATENTVIAAFAAMTDIEFCNLLRSLIFTGISR